MQFYDQYGKPIDRPQSIADWDFNYGQGFTNTALAKLGISPEQFAANPNLFGGTNGVVKGGIWQDPLDDLYNSGMSDSGSGGSYPTLRQFLDGYNLDNIRYQGNDAPQWQRDALSAYDNALAQKDPLPGFFQITPEYFSGANSPVDGVGGRRYLEDLSGIKYDPKWGFIAPESAYRATSDGKGDFALTSIGAMLAAYTGGLALTGGLGGAAAGELGAAGVGGAGEAAGSSLYSLGSGGGNLGFNASGFLGGAGTTPGVGFVAPSAAGWGGFGAAEALGGLGAFSADYGLGSGAGNLGFDASGAFGGTSNLGGAAGSGLGINTPASSGWWGAGSGVAQAAPTGSLFEQLKSAYDQYGKPVSQANSALKMLGGGGSTGTGGPMLRTQEQSIPAHAGGSTMQGGGMGAGPPGSGYPGFPLDGLPQMPQYQQQGQQPQQDPNWFIPEYLKRGVIGR